MDLVQAFNELYFTHIGYLRFYKVSQPQEQLTTFRLLDRNARGEK